MSHTPYFMATGTLLEQHMASRFRGDIEGLRAVAVLLVIAAHYALPGFAGGFVGVDIFFVISGYLITALLVREHEETGRIALLRFYANRLRRLLPALLTMLVVCTAAAWLLLPMNQQPAQNLGAAMAAWWVSNFYFAFSDVDYFAAETVQNVFLHTWSLGIEEQFYLAWPLLTMLCIAWARGAGWRLAFAGLVFSVLSLGICLAWTYGREPMLAYYLMPARAWQFAAGALTWLGTRQYVPTALQARAMAWVGGLMLLGSMVFVGPHISYPGVWALLPTFAACAFLAAGTAPTPSRCSVVLACGPLRGIGRLSYSWYLWHWPVLVIGQELVPVHGSLGGTTMALGISLLAAMATHHWIEKPVRFGRMAQWRHGWQVVLLVGLMFVFSTLMLLSNRHAQQLLDDASAAQNAYTQAMRDTPSLYRDRCDDWYHSDELKPCRYGNRSTGEKVVLWGDSIGAQWFPAITQMFDLQQWEVIVLTKSSCPLVDEPFFYARIGREYTECATWRDRAMKWLQQEKVRYLFMGSAAYPELSVQQWTQGTQRILQRLAPSLEVIYVLETSPSLPFHGPNCIREKLPEGCRSPMANLQRQQVAQALQATVQAQPNAHWLATAAFVCPNGMCDALHRDQAGREIAAFRDNQHLTASFAALAAPYFTAQMAHSRAAAASNSGVDAAAD